MDLRKQLPQIGVVLKSGDFKLGDCLIWQNDERPDYEDFKRGVYKTEVECVSAIVGVCYVERIIKIMRDKMEERRDELIASRKDSKRSLSYDDCKKDKLFCDYERVILLFNDIRQMIDDGLKAKEISFLRDDQRSSFDKNVDFYRGRRLNSIEFLNWAEKNGYNIPLELTRATDGKSWTNIQEYNELRQKELLQIPFVKDAVELAAIVGVMSEREQKPIVKNKIFDILEGQTKKFSLSGNAKYPGDLICKAFERIDGFMKQGPGRPKKQHGG